MLSMTPGYDPGYLTRSTAEPKNYYLAAISQHGEPQGRWWGSGAAKLGLTPGSVIDARVMEQLYSTFNDPNSPDFYRKECQDRLGRRPPTFKDAETWYELMLDQEPEASAERCDQMWSEAVQRSERQNTAWFYDATFSPFKSVSLLHAGLQAAAKQAEWQGKHELAGQYYKAADEVWEGVRRGAEASLEYLTSKAGDARIGSHGSRIEGRSTGRWTDGGGFVVARFEQHTNREGEPNLHIHQAILNRQFCPDGVWRSIDSRALFRSRAGAAAVGEREMMEYLTRVLGAEWVQRADGNGWEIKGVEPEQIAAFSTRRARITAELERVLAEYERKHKHQPSARALYKISQYVTTNTRPSKGEKQLSRAGFLKRWEDRLNREEISSLLKIPARVLGRIRPDRTAKPFSLDRENDAEVARILTTAVARAQAAKNVFTRHDVLRRINDELPEHLGILGGPHLERLLNELTDMALDPAGPAGVRLLNAPDVVNVPDELCRSDGRSAYLAPNAERYTTVERLDRLQRLTSEALRDNAPRVRFFGEVEHELVWSPIQLRRPETLNGLLVAPRVLTAPVERGEHQPMTLPGWSELVAEQVERLRQEGRSWTEVAVEMARLVPIRHEGIGSQTLGYLTREAAAESDAVVDTFVGELLDRELRDEPSLLRGELDPIGDEVPPNSEGSPPNSHEKHEEREQKARLSGWASPPVAPVEPEHIQRLLEATADAVSYYQDQLHSPTGQEARRYLDGRGLSAVTAPDAAWRVGYAPDQWDGLFLHLSRLGYTNDELEEAGLVRRSARGTYIDRFRGRVMLPVTDQYGRPVGFTARLLPGVVDDPRAPKYLNTPETPIYRKSELLYAHSEQAQALAAGARPVIVEGPLDALAIHLAQDPDAPGLVGLATCGTALTDQHVRVVADAAVEGVGLVVAFDPDPAGRKAAKRAHEHLGGYEGGPVHAAMLPEGQDPGDLVGEPERLNELLDERDRTLEMAVLAYDIEQVVDAFRHRPYPVSDRTPEQIRREAAASWGFEPPESVDEPAAEPGPSPARLEAGSLTMERSHAAAEAVARLVPAGDVVLARYALAHLQEVIGRVEADERELLQLTFLNEFIGTDSSIEGEVEATSQPIRSGAEVIGDEVEAVGGEVEGTSQPIRGQAKVIKGEAEATSLPMGSEKIEPVTQRELALRHVMAEFPTLRQDQGEAIAGILTSGRGVDQLVGPAGSGKSYVLAKLAQVWKERTETPVTGLALAQNAANVLRNEGLDESYNIVKWLKLLETGQTRIVPGQLIVVDEYSMVDNELLAKVQMLATKSHVKIVWAGDHEQLPAPGAGGMGRYLNDVAGAYELTEVARFAEKWERDASLRLREGRAEILAEYDKRGRLFAGTREDATNRALRSYLADLLAGRDTLLLTSTNEHASELSARVRAELVEAGRVEQDGLVLADHNVAGQGDLIMARANERRVRVGTGERTLTNRDLLEVIETREDGSIRAVLNGTQKDEEPVYVTLPADYVADHVELGYAGTAHAAQGRTVDTCHGIADETTTRQMWYVIMTRGRYGNWAYGVAERERIADLRTGPEQSEEYMARQRRAAARERGELGSEVEHIDREVDEINGEVERIGEEDNAEQPPSPEQVEAALREALDRQRLGVFATLLGRDGADQTSIEAMYREFERSRHSGHLGAMWLDSTHTYQAIAYLERAVERGTMNREDADRALAEDELSTLGQRLGRIEAAGMNTDGILDQAFGYWVGELGSAQSVCRVLDWRIKHLAEQEGVDLDALEPTEEEIHGTQVQRTKPLGIPAIDRFRFELAEAIDDRADELAHRAAERPPRWLAERLGFAPEANEFGEPTQERQTWLSRARAILSYREQWMYEAETDAIGPAPSKQEPERRAAWLAAREALGDQGERDLSTLSIGDLYMMRSAYTREVQWAPPYVAPQLRAAALQARDLSDEAAILKGRAQRMEDPERRAGLLARAAARAELSRELSAHCAELSLIDNARSLWYEATEDKRALAQRADAELRRRAREDVRAERTPRVEVATLEPLHLDTAEARERVAEHERRAKAAEIAQLDQCPGQERLELELSEPSPSALKRAKALAEQVQEQEQERERLEEVEPVHRDQLSLDVREGELVPGQEWRADWLAQRERDDVHENQLSLDIREGELVPGRTEPVDREAELDRMIDQARHVVEHVDSRGEAERDAELEEIHQRHREQAREIDESLLERERVAREELEARETERQMPEYEHEQAPEREPEPDEYEHEYDEYEQEELEL